MSQSEIAERIGVSRQRVNNLLTGPGSKNWTLDTIGDLLAAMDFAVSGVSIRKR